MFDSLHKKVLNVEQSPMQTASLNQRIFWNPGGHWDGEASVSGYFRYRADRSVQHIQYAFADGNMLAALNYQNEAFTNKFTVRITSYNVCYTKLLRKGVGLRYNFHVVPNGAIADTIKSMVFGCVCCPLTTPINQSRQIRLTCPSKN